MSLQVLVMSLRTIKQRDILISKQKGEALTHGTSDTEAETETNISKELRNHNNH